VILSMLMCLAKWRFLLGVELIGQTADTAPEGGPEAAPSLGAMSA
jgi:hypothetical protein